MSLTNADFKADVKVVLEDVAREKGSPDFTAMVYDDKDAVTAEAYQDGPLSKKEMERRARHLFATYMGGIDPYGQPSSFDYTISWFPGADKHTSKVGKYVKWDVDWEPSP